MNVCYHPTAVRVELIDPARNEARFYILSALIKLWGEPAMVCTWRWIVRPGRTLARAMASFTEAAVALDRARRVADKQGHAPKALN